MSLAEDGDQSELDNFGLADYHPLDVADDALGRLFYVGDRRLYYLFRHPMPPEL
jgi:hypothetical protein